MSWSGSACCVSCDPVHWKANNLSSPAVCSSHRTAITVTTPKSTSQQPNLADFNRNPPDSSCDQITHSQKYSGPNTFGLFSIVILLIVRVSKESQNSCIGYTTEMTWFASLTQKRTEWKSFLRLQRQSPPHADKWFLESQKPLFSNPSQLTSIAYCA